MSEEASAGDGGNGSSDDWRKCVSQSYRSEEVRSIAKVLASLEPGATSASKTMLAMRFEETIFKAASSLDDYRKTIQKRLKRLQKHYSKQQSAGAKGAESADVTREKELLLERELRDTFGARLLYIAKHADSAVESTREKHGDQRADILKQHAKNAKQWAVHLGLALPEGCSGPLPTRQERRDMAFLNKLKSYLESRVENIRSHIVKITDPDLFLEETLVKVEDDLLNGPVSAALQAALKEADPDAPEFSPAQLKRLLDRANAPVPIPRRNQQGDKVRAAVARVEKVRAAAQALYTFMGLTHEDKTAFRGVLKRCHAIVMDCLDTFQAEYDSVLEESGGTDHNSRRLVHLEDAWNNPLQLTDMDQDPAPVADAAEEVGPNAKRPKLEHPPNHQQPMVIRAQVLLTPGRHTLSTLAPHLAKKKATLVRNAAATYVRLAFENAFEMTIFFVPLLVTIRAMTGESKADDQIHATSSMGGLRWPSAHRGLRPPENDNVDAAPAPNNAPAASTKQSNSSSLHILGVAGTYSTVGPIIAKKLEYASAQATYVLRRCFADAMAEKGSLAKNDFEIEIIEAGALFRFLQIARSTYMPDWTDEG